MDWLSRIFDVSKLPVRIIFGVAFVSGVLVFPPSNLLERLAIADFMKVYGAHVGVVFLASVALVAIYICSWLVNTGRRKVGDWRWRAKLKDNLMSLDRAEKSVLREFYLQCKNTIELPMDNPTVAGLLNKGIIRPVGTVGEYSRVGMLLPFCISEDARTVISRRGVRDMLELPIGNPSEQELDRLKKSRPDFMR